MQAGRCFLPQGTHHRLKEVLHIDLVSRWLKKGWFRERGVWSGASGTVQGQGFMKQALHQSLTQGGLNSLLRYEDRNSMAFSIESRVPFLTPDFAAFAWSLPEEYLIDQNGRSKSVFRSAMEGTVPETILKRKDKIGFATPERRWLSVLKTWVQAVLESDVAKSLPMIQLNKVVADWEQLLSDKNSFDWRFWRVINLIKWAEEKNVEMDSNRAT
jgi:asparagine synthase (glutamine-hydrolysing)